MPECNLNTKSCDKEATPVRYPYAVKKYALPGNNIPLNLKFGNDWILLPANYDLCWDEILNLDLLKDDVFVVTFMKCGTTWMQECAWLLLNNLDFTKSKRQTIMQRSPYLEYKSFVPTAAGPAETVMQMARPRLIKTHVPAHLLPLQIWQKKQKVIYVARNVKDAIVSSYHFLKNTTLWIGNSLPDYVEDFLGNELLFTPFWSHVLSFWFMRHESFIFFVTYEEMQRDLAGVLQKLGEFLDRPQLSAKQLETITKYLSFDSMKKNRTTNMTHQFKSCLPAVKDNFEFMRRGIVGSFKDELPAELIVKIDVWSAGILSQYGLKEEDIFGKFWRLVCKTYCSC